MKRSRSKHKKGERFARLPVTLVRHPAVTTLDHAAFRVLTLFAAEYCGNNNGAIGLTAAQASELGIGSNHTFYKALSTLEERGLLLRTYPASRIPPRPAMFALEWVPVDDTKFSAATRTASHRYKKWPLQIAS